MYQERIVKTRKQFEAYTSNVVSQRHKSGTVNKSTYVNPKTLETMMTNDGIEDRMNEQTMTTSSSHHSNEDKKK